FAQPGVFFLQVSQERYFVVFVEQVSGNGDAAACIEHVHYTLIILGGYLHGSMHAACGCTAYEQWLLHAAAFHFLSHMHHLIERWSDKAAKAYDVHILPLCGIQYFISWHHYTKVYYIVAVTAQHYAHYVL